MEKTLRYRHLRLSCRITMAEIARDVGISPQRLYQLETCEQGYRVENPGRLIKALENAVARQRDNCQRALYCCAAMRGEMFAPLESGAEA